MPKKQKAKGKGRERNLPALVIGDLHEPFTSPGYLDFCRDMHHRHGCGNVVFIGDVVDHHALSFHDHDPSGLSAGHEAERARAALCRWRKAFPSARVCIGNHDARIYRRAVRFGIPRHAIRALSEIYDVPGWDFALRHEIDGVLYLHGSGYGGINAHRRAAERNRQSVVIGHLHAFAGVSYLACPLDLIFGMNVGCGIDVQSYAMEYAKEFDQKPVLGCGVVFGPREAQFIPMDLGDRR